MDVDANGSFETGVILEGYIHTGDTNNGYTYDGIHGVPSDGWVLDVSLF